MRKVFLAVIALLGFALTTSAQEVKKTVKKTEKTVTAAGKKEVKTTEKVIMKKDGTPDKRYKTTQKVVLNIEFTFHWDKKRYE